MWRLKSCPRCGGDMFFDRGLDSWYLTCIQCSFESELMNMTNYKSISPIDERETVLNSSRKHKK
jgi:hypothetical protein